MTTETTIPKAYKSKTEAQAAAHVAEECAEVLAAFGKAIRFGWESYNPEKPIGERETNYDWFIREVRDVKRAIEVLNSFYQPRVGEDL